MKMRWVSTLMLAVVAAAALTACRRLEPSSAGVRVESYPQNAVSINSEFFNGWFKVQQVAIAKGDNDLLQATIMASNLKNSDCQVEYRYRWIDAQGIELSSIGTTWTPLAVAAMEKVMFTSIAPSRKAADFILDIRFNYRSTRFAPQ